MRKLLNSYKLGGGEPLPITLQITWANGGLYQDGIALFKRLPLVEVLFERCRQGLDEEMEALLTPQRLTQREEIATDDSASTVSGFVRTCGRSSSSSASCPMPAPCCGWSECVRMDGGRWGRMHPALPKCVKLEAGLFDVKGLETLRGALGGIAFWK